MTLQARVSSTEALEAFRSCLIDFISRSNSAVDQVTDEIRRLRNWIQNDQRLHWEGELRRRSRVLAQAEQELFSARLVKMLDNLASQQAAVRKARRALEEAGEKLRNVKSWSRDFDGATDPLTRSLNSFREMLARDMPRGISFLTQAQKTLDAYSEVRPPPAKDGRGDAAVEGSAALPESPSGP